TLRRRVLARAGTNAGAHGVVPSGAGGGQPRGAAALAIPNNPLRENQRHRGQFPMAGKSCTRTQLDAIARRVGISYPPACVAHVTGRFPGVYIEAKEAVWPRPRPFHVGPLWSFLYAIHTYTAAPESQPWMRLDVVAEKFQADTGLKAAPILAIDGDADVYCATPEG